MGAIPWGAAWWVALGILQAAAAASPSAEAPWAILPRGAARLAVEEFNRRSLGEQADVFRLFKLRSTQKTRLEWGVHFRMYFTIRETQCRKPAPYRIGVCRYRPNGLIKDCSADVSFLSLMPESPLISVNCLQAKGTDHSGQHRPEPSFSPPQEHYMPASYSTAALT